MIIIFGGTTEGRELIKICNVYQIPAIVCVATSYGEEVLEESENIKVLEGRMDIPQMLSILKEYSPDLILDATHPYAQEVSKNIKYVCEKINIKRIRILRVSKVYNMQNILYYKEISFAVQYLQNTKGNILLTIGSKQIEEFREISMDRIYVRILPDIDSIKACMDIGIPRSHIMAMQGPFSTEMNIALLKEWNCKYLITKESGKVGGFEEKIKACNHINIQAVVITRPEKEEGMSLEEVYKILKEYHLDREKKIEKKNIQSPNISIVGIGPGNITELTYGAIQEILYANAIVGGERMLAFAREVRKSFGILDRYEELSTYQPEKILAKIPIWIQEKYYIKKIAILMSGDIGFFSGTKKLLDVCLENGFKPKLIPGISSLSYFATTLGIAWEDIKIISLHGREEDIVEVVKKYSKVFAITSGGEKNNEIIKRLVEHGWGEAWIYIGENLSYPKQKIVVKQAKDLMEYSFAKLSVFIISYSQIIDRGIEQIFVKEKKREERKENFFIKQIEEIVLEKNGNRRESNKNGYYIGISDKDFIRGQVPMTKEEIRILSLAKLQIQSTDICYDIGAGTGSVSIEMARLAKEGYIYAIEKKEEAIDLIDINTKKFGISNLSIIYADIIDVLENLPKPDCVFIGGSSGKIQKILEIIFAKNKNAHVVVNAISLETIAELTRIIPEYEKKEYRIEITWVNIAKSKKIANYHMMMGQNPVMIVDFKGNEV